MYLPISVSLNPHFREQRIDNVFQDPGHAFLKNLQRKLLFKFLPADLAHVAAQDRIIQEKQNLVSKHSNIMLRNEEARLTIINNSWYSPSVVEIQATPCSIASNNTRGKHSL